MKYLGTITDDKDLTTKEYVDNSITPIEDAITELNDKFTSYLPDDTNIDNWTITGFWLYQRTSPRSHTGTFPNSDLEGTLVHVQGSSTSVAMQMIRSNRVSKESSILRIRFKNSTWGSWFTFRDSNKKSGYGTATNDYGSCSYSWERLGDIIATVQVEYTPNQAISSSSGSFALTNTSIPIPASDGIIAATYDTNSPATVCGSAELSMAKNCTFYGPRTSGHVYKTSFTYIMD